MRSLNVYLADLSYNNRLNRNNRHIPKNLGYLASYAQAMYGDAVAFTLFNDADALFAAMEERRPDVLGMSFYAWNTSLGHTVAQLVRQRWGRETAIVWGGPSVDTDRAEQRRLFARFPEVNAFIANEGELGFAAVLGRFLGGADPWRDAIDGVIHLAPDGVMLCGADVGLSLSLDLLPSPYLSGILDPFLNGDLLPGVQTSRLCPYTCAFCASGKNTGKLRGFPIEQVKEELVFIAKRFTHRPYVVMHINDENFGILPRDAEIAEHIRHCRDTYGYPQSVFFYHDKRLTETTRKVLLSLGSFSTNGMTVSLQTENPEALATIKRKPVSVAQLNDSIDWAAANGIACTTELIFGLPGETRASFIRSLDDAVTRGFEAVLCNTLFIVDGIELNRQAERARLGLVTKFRLVRDNYGLVQGRFCAEVEEVVVGARSFDIVDYLEIRRISMVFYACFTMRFHYWIVSYIRLLGLSVTELAILLTDPNSDDASHRLFAVEFEQAAVGELHDDPASLRVQIEDIFRANGNDVGDAVQLNVRFGARLIYEEEAWIDRVLVSVVAARCADQPEAVEIAHLLIDLYRRECVDVHTLLVPEPQDCRWDVLAWRAGKFRRPLSDYPLAVPCRIVFSLKPTFLRMYERFRIDFADSTAAEFYVTLQLNITPRSELLMDLSYAPAA